jgi:hypothetical protein
MWQALIAAATLTVFSPAFAQTQNAHHMEINTFVTVFVAADIAESDCGMRVNKGALAMIRSTANIRATDEAYVDQQIKAVARVAYSNVSRLGRALWCQQAEGFYGANGTVLKGLLTKSNR